MKWNSLKRRGERMVMTQNQCCAVPAMFREQRVLSKVVTSGEGLKEDCSLSSFFWFHERLNGGTSSIEISLGQSSKAHYSHRGPFCGVITWEQLNTCRNKITSWSKGGFIRYSTSIPRSCVTWDMQMYGFSSHWCWTFHWWPLFLHLVHD